MDPRPLPNSVLDTDDIRPASPADRQILVPVLARAFASDPLTDWFVLGDSRREQRLHHLFGWYLEQALPLGHSHATSDATGAALWMGPGQWKLPLLRQLILLADVLRVVGPGRALSRIRGVDAFQRRHPRKPHYYLAVLGVEPDRQGQGIGSRLLARGLRRCDQQKVPAYLETSTERNLPLYQRHSFRITGELVVPGGGPRLWLMWRDPVDTGQG